jgi:hypothetical protein
VKNKLVFIAIIVVLVAIIIFLSWWFKRELEDQRLAIEMAFTKIANIQYQASGSVPERSVADLERLSQEAIERYFFSEVQLIDNYYIPKINLCLHELGQPIYPLYVYDTFSTLYYPEKPPYQKALVRFLLLPEDNVSFQPDSKCFTKEIKSDGDWEDLAKYGFLKELF